MVIQQADASKSSSPIVSRVYGQDADRRAIRIPILDSLTIPIGVICTVYSIIYIFMVRSLYILFLRFLGLPLSLDPRGTAPTTLLTIGVGVDGSLGYTRRATIKSYSPCAPRPLWEYRLTRNDVYLQRDRHRRREYISHDSPPGG